MPSEEHEPSELAELLRTFRTRAGLTQEELAERAQLSAEAIGALERGRRRRPHADTVALLAGALRLSPPESETLAAAARGAVSPAGQVEPVAGFLGATAPDPLIGREGELRRLRTAIEAAREGQGRLVLLAGEAGVGKTRLAQEAWLQLREENFLVAAGRCDELHTSVPYFPFLEPLEAIYNGQSATSRATIPGRWPGLAVLVPGLGDPSSSSEDGRPQILRSIAGFLRDAAPIQPVAVLIDDLHWADGSSLELLHHIARETRGHPVFLLATYRDVEVRRGQVLEATLGLLDREGLSERVDVPRFKRAETAGLIADLERRPAPDRLVDAVQRWTEGNPYLVRQVVQMMAQREEAREDLLSLPGRVGTIGVPTTARFVISQRLQHLSGMTQNVLREASVLGQTFEFRILEAVGHHQGDELDAALEEAVDVGLLREDRSDAYVFDHALTQQTLYEELSSRRRVLLHERAGRALEELPENRRMPRVAELARHFLQGGDDERALTYALLAGDQAEAVFAHSEAADQYRTAVELAFALGETGRQLEALNRLGESLRVAGRPEEALKVLGEGLELARRLRDREAELRIAASMGWAHSRALSAEAGIELLEPVLQRALTEGGEHCESPGLAGLSTALARLYMITFRNADMLQAASRGAAIARRVGDHKLHPRAQALLATALNRNADDDAAKAVSRVAYEEAIRLSEEAGDEETLSRCLTNLGNILCMELGELEGAARMFERGLALARRRGDPEDIIFGASKLASARFFAGEWAGAGALLEEARALGDEAGGLWARMIALAESAALARAMGNFEAARADLEQMGAMAARAGDREYMLGVPTGLAACDLLMDRPQDALRRLQDISEDDLGRIPNLETFVAEVWLCNGRVEEARQTAERVLAAARSLGDRWGVRAALRVLGMVCTRQGRWDSAQAAFEEALSLIARDVFLYEDVQILYELAVMLLEKGDVVEGRRRMEEVASICRRLGARPYLARAEAALAGL